jgi:hypothetical protein
LVDNEFGEQLGGPINVFPKWYDMCGLPFICPQTSAFKVLKSKPDFAPEQGIINLSNYVEEGWVIAKELVQRCEAEDRSYVFLIANALTTDISAYLKERNDASSSKGMHSIFVFRNQVAESKTTATVKFPEHLESAIAEQYPGFA